jgi:hypothetical protein
MYRGRCTSDFVDLPASLGGNTRLSNLESKGNSVRSIAKLATGRCGFDEAALDPPPKFLCPFVCRKALSTAGYVASCKCQKREPRSHTGARSTHCRRVVPPNFCRPSFVAPPLHRKNVQIGVRSVTMKETPELFAKALRNRPSCPALLTAVLVRCRRGISARPLVQERHYLYPQCRHLHGRQR